MKKRIGALLLAAALILGVAGCGGTTTQKVDGGTVETKKDGTTTFKGDDGTTVTVGKEKWDSGKMHGLPEPKAKLESSLTTSEGAMYGFSEMKEKDAEKYIETVKNAGFTYNLVEMGAEMYQGTDKDGKVITFTFAAKEGTGTVTASVGEKPSEDKSTKFGSDLKWPTSDLAKVIPELKEGKLVLLTEEPDNVTIALQEVTPEAALKYLESVKTDFTVDPYEMKLENGYSFSGENADGVRVSLTFGEGMLNIGITKD